MKKNEKIIIVAAVIIIAAIAFLLSGDGNDFWGNDPTLVVESSVIQKGTIYGIPVFISNCPSDLYYFHFVIPYNNTLLSYKGPDTSQSEFFSISTGEFKPGHIRVYGYTSAQEVPNEELSQVLKFKFEGIETGSFQMIPYELTFYDDDPIENPFAKLIPMKVKGGKIVIS